MSIIVWDGNILASDEQLTRSGTLFRGPKLWNDGQYVFGGVGDYGYLYEMKSFFESICLTRNQTEYPDFQKTDRFVRSIFVNFKSSSISVYERTRFPIRVEWDSKYAIGSATDIAMGAMFAGANAIEAVSACIHLNDGCGLGISAFSARDYKNINLEAKFKINVPVTFYQIQVR